MRLHCGSHAREILSRDSCDDLVTRLRGEKSTGLYDICFTGAILLVTVKYGLFELLCRVDDVVVVLNFECVIVVD